MSAIQIILSAMGIILKVAAICFLAGYLVFKHRQRLRNWLPTEDPGEWTGKAIDATKLIPAVDRVRHDYIAAQFRRSEDLLYRGSLLALAGRAIRRLRFFRRRYDNASGHVSREQAALITL